MDVDTEDSDMTITTTVGPEEMFNPFNNSEECGKPADVQDYR